MGQVLRQVDGGYEHWCPACGGVHMIAVSEPFPNGARWSFDGNLDKPTFRPSVRIRWGQRLESCCHYWLKAGQIQFCKDCTHALAGETVPLPALPAHLQPRSQ